MKLKRGRGDEDEARNRRKEDRRQGGGRKEKKIGSAREWEEATDVR